MTIGYLSPKMEVRHAPEKGGYAVFALETLIKDETLAIWGGRIASLDEVLALPPEQRGHTVQVSDGFYLAPLEMDEPADYINHSCDPNAGLFGQIILVAMRDIGSGEEITFDYAMSDSSPFDEFPCACGSARCRKQVTANDWKRPDLWERYDGYFSPYLQRKINQIRNSK